MARVGDVLNLFVQYYDSNHAPVVPIAPVNIRVLYDNTEIILPAAQVESSNVFQANVTPTQAGVVLWRGETVDTEVSFPLTMWGAEWVVTQNSEPTLSEIKAALQLGGVTLISPVTQNGALMIVVIGDDYKVSEDRAFTWDVSELGINFAGATIVWSIEDQNIAVTEDTGILTLELTSVFTATLNADTYPYAIRATLANGNTVTLVQGQMKVQSILSDNC